VSGERPRPDAWASSFVGNPLVKRSGGHTSKSNFTRVTWNEPELLVQVFERKGGKTAEARFTL
jgi:hypothetical protein